MVQKDDPPNDNRDRLARDTQQLAPEKEKQYWNSSLLGAGERHSTLDKGHEEGGSAYAKVGSSLGSPPGYSLSTPKNQSLPTLLLCALTSDFTGGCPPPPSHSLCQRVNLQVQLIKFLGN